MAGAAPTFLISLTLKKNMWKMTELTSWDWEHKKSQKSVTEEFRERESSTGSHAQSLKEIYFGIFKYYPILRQSALRIWGIPTD